MPFPTRRPRLSPSIGLLLVLLGLVISPAARAQIVNQKPAQVKAANRRALREAQHTESPYKASHLAVTPARLRRGQSTPLPSDGNDGQRPLKAAVAARERSGFLGLRRKK